TDLHGLSNGFRSHRVCGPRLLDFLEIRLGKASSMSCRPRSSAPVSSKWEKRWSAFSTSNAFARVPIAKDGSPRSNRRKVAVETCRRSAMDCVEIRLRRLARPTSLPSWVKARRTGRGRDRKSTRLNSSHVAISYAVFCLKKKKIQETGYPDLGLSRRDQEHRCLA